MLIQLTPEQVNKYWEALRPMVRQSLPDTVSKSKVARTNILSSALTGKAVFWGYYKKDEDKDDLEPGGLTALVVTSIDRDPVTKLKRLLVFAFWGSNDVQRGDIAKGLNTLEEYAEGRNCSVMYSFSANPGLSRVLETMSWNSEQDLIYKTL